MYSNSKLPLFFLQVTLAIAQLSTTCFDGDICYRLNIPEETANTAQGDIFLQVTAPTTFSWVSIGQGSGMMGSHMFIVYAANENNVTVSSRLGIGEVEPVHTSETQFLLLDGSGISDGVMTANIRCSNCQSWSGGEMAFSATSAQWIHAAHSGSALQSFSPTERLLEHNAGHEHFDWDMASAVGGDSLNPFINDALLSGPNNTQTSTAEPFPPAVLLAHAICTCIAMVVLFPVGSMGLRLLSLRSTIWVHAGIQATALVTFVAGAACGIYVAVADGYLQTPHAIIGLLLLGSLLFQPVFGLLHHFYFKKVHRRTYISYVHIWLGRGAITLGIINGGLGLQLTGGSKPWNIAYGVVAGVIWLAWVIAAGYSDVKQFGSAQGGERNSSKQECASDLTGDISMQSRGEASS